MRLSNWQMNRLPLKEALFLIGLLIIYSLVMVTLHPLLGNTVIILSILVVALMAWYFGLWYGLFTAFLTIPLNILLLNYLGFYGWFILFRTPGGVMGTSFLIIIGFMIGTLHDLNEKYRKERLARMQAENKTVQLLEKTQGINEQLKMMDRLKDEFLSIVTHDLQNPLFAMSEYAKILLEGLLGKMTEKQISAVEVIKKQSKNLQEMIDSLLDYTRIEFGKIKVDAELFSVNTLMAELLETIKPQADVKKIALSASLPNEDLSVNADRRMIFRVISNILGNAIKYTQKGGKVEIALDKEKGAARIQVSDNGRGISKEDLPRIFDKFFMVESAQSREKKSLGLGMHIAKDFVEANGGRIFVESKGEGKGATFGFSLPLA